MNIRAEHTRKYTATAAAAAARRAIKTPNRPLRGSRGLRFR